MSYVLEALRRAEAERHRGQVPGLDAQPLPAPAAGLVPAGSPRPGWLWPVAAVAALSALALVWWLLTPAAQPPALRPAPPTSNPPPAARVPPAAPAPAPPLATLPMPPVARAAPARPAASASAAESRLLRLQDLPEASRRQMPPLAFGGATDSPEPSARMLIINGQVYREGDEPAPGLLLERITLRSAQFRWRGQRLEMGY